MSREGGVLKCPQHDLGLYAACTCGGGEPWPEQEDCCEGFYNGVGHDRWCQGEVAR